MSSSCIPGNFRFVNVAMDTLEVSEDCIILYLIVDAVLSAFMLAKTFNVPLPGSSDDPESRNVETEELLEATTSSHEKSARHPDLDEAAVLYERVMQGSMSADQVCQSGVITRIGDALQRETKFL